MINGYKYINEETNLISSIEHEQLAEVLRIDYENLDELSNKSDCFSVSCLKSLTKLNKLLFSENTRLIMCSFINMILRKDSILHLFKIMLSNFIMINQFNKDMHRLMLIIKLEAKEAESKPVNVSTPNKTAHTLGLYLRNTLLYVYKLENSHKNLELLENVKHGVQCVDVYLKQLLNEIEPKKCENLKDSGRTIEEPKIIPPELNECLIEKPEDYVVQDEIFEMDTANLVIDKDEKLNNNQDEFTETDRLVNKNLYYELKYALKTKKMNGKNEKD